MSTFKRITQDEAQTLYMSGGSTSLQAYFDTSYAKLREKFGEPEEGDGYKVSTEWQFVDGAGNMATLYDYKETDLYGESSVSVSDFRARSSYEWHVGAKDKQVADAFVRWLTAEVGR